MADNKYNGVLKYISYFEDDTNAFYKWESSRKNDEGFIILRHPIYSNEFEQFIDEYYKSDLIMQDYLELL